MRNQEIHTLNKRYMGDEMIKKTRSIIDVFNLM